MEQPNPQMNQFMMTPRLKGLLLILIFTFIASGISLIVYAQVQSYGQDQVYLATRAALPVHKAAKTDMSDLKTYTSSQYGFEMQYPPAYEMSDKPQRQGFYTYQITRILNFAGKDNNIDDTNFSVFADNNSKNIGNCLTDGQGTSLTQTKDINGSKFYVLYEKTPDSAMGGERAEVSEYHIIQNNYCFILNFRVHWHEVGFALEPGPTPEQIQAQAASVDKNEKILEQMLASFKFTNDVSAWKTYTNSQYGFEFKYPSNWSISPINTGGGYDQSKPFILLWAGNTSDEPCQDLGCLPKSGNRDVLTKGDTYEGGPPLSPWYKILRVSGNKWVSIQVTDINKNCSSETSCQGYLTLVPIQERQKLAGQDYVTYNEFIDLLNTFKF